ncbi:MAG: FtsX-like permease family protein, partial [Gammaproteobacteria bacterium]|nr:FtsX-like permease family protein [Gammaproteobacteria bacterium]
VHDVGGADLKVPEYGLIIGTELAKKLEVGVGDTISVEIREGRKPTVELPVVDLVETYIDLPAFMHLSSLSRLLLETTSTDFISVLIDKSRQDEFYRELKQTPRVSAVMLRELAVDNFNSTMAETFVIFIGFFGVFSAALGFGVVYNSTRITLSERGRELASLRVLGFSRAAISYILLGEVGVLILIALPVGCLIGWSLAWLIVETAFNNEMFRLPLIIYPSSYGIAILVTLASSALSAALVQRRLNHLDLIAVLKTRE